MCDTEGKTTAWGQNNVGFVFPLFYISIFNQTTPDAKCIRNYRFDIKPVWVRCSGNCLPVQACKKIISNKTVRFVSGKSLHFVGILQAWKTSFLSKHNLPQGGTQKISEKARERKTHYQILRGLQRPILPLHLPYINVNITSDEKPMYDIFVTNIIWEM